MVLSEPASGLMRKKNRVLFAADEHFVTNNFELESQKQKLSSSEYNEQVQTKKFHSRETSKTMSERGSPPSQDKLISSLLAQEYYTSYRDCTPKHQPNMHTSSIGMEKIQNREVFGNKSPQLSSFQRRREKSKDFNERGIKYLNLMDDLVEVFVQQGRRQNTKPLRMSQHPFQNADVAEVSNFTGNRAGKPQLQQVAESTDNSVKMNNFLSRIEPRVVSLQLETDLQRSSTAAAVQSNIELAQNSFKPGRVIAGIRAHQGSRGRLSKVQLSNIKTKSVISGVKVDLKPKLVKKASALEKQYCLEETFKVDESSCVGEAAFEKQLQEQTLRNSSLNDNLNTQTWERMDTFGLPVYGEVDLSYFKSNLTIENRVSNIKNKDNLCFGDDQTRISSQSHASFGLVQQSSRKTSPKLSESRPETLYYQLNHEQKLPQFSRILAQFENDIKTDLSSGKIQPNESKSGQSNQKDKFSLQIASAVRPIPSFSTQSNELIKDKCLDPVGITLTEKDEIQPAPLVFDQNQKQQKNNKSEQDRPLKPKKVKESFKDRKMRKALLREFQLQIKPSSVFFKFRKSSENHRMRKFVPQTSIQIKAYQNSFTNPKEALQQKTEGRSTSDHQKSETRTKLNLLKKQKNQQMADIKGSQQLDKDGTGRTLFLEMSGPLPDDPSAKSKIILNQKKSKQRSQQNASQQHSMVKSQMPLVDRHLHLQANDLKETTPSSKAVTPLKSNNISNNDEEEEDIKDILASTILQTPPKKHEQVVQISNSKQKSQIADKIRMIYTEPLENPLVSSSPITKKKAILSTTKRLSLGKDNRQINSSQANDRMSNQKSLKDDRKVIENFESRVDQLKKSRTVFKIDLGTVLHKDKRTERNGDRSTRRSVFSLSRAVENSSPGARSHNSEEVQHSTRIDTEKTIGKDLQKVICVVDQSQSDPQNVNLFNSGQLVTLKSQDLQTLDQLDKSKCQKSDQLVDKGLLQRHKHLLRKLPKSMSRDLGGNSILINPYETIEAQQFQVVKPRMVSPSIIRPRDLRDKQSLKLQDKTPPRLQENLSIIKNQNEEQERETNSAHSKETVSIEIIRKPGLDLQQESRSQLELDKEVILIQKKRKISKAAKIARIKNLIGIKQKISNAKWTQLDEEAQLKTNFQMKILRDAAGASTPPPCKKGTQKNKQSLEQMPQDGLFKEIRHFTPVLPHEYHLNDLKYKGRNASVLKGHKQPKKDSKVCSAYNTVETDPCHLKKTLTNKSQLLKNRQSGVFQSSPLGASDNLNLKQSYSLSIRSRNNNNSSESQNFNGRIMTQSTKTGENFLKQAFSLNQNTYQSHEQQGTHATTITQISNQQSEKQPMTDIVQINRPFSKMTLLKGGKQLRYTFGSYHGKSKVQYNSQKKKQKLQPQGQMEKWAQQTPETFNNPHENDLEFKQFQTKQDLNKGAFLASAQTNDKMHQQMAETLTDFLSYQSQQKSVQSQQETHFMMSGESSSVQDQAARTISRETQSLRKDEKRIIDKIDSDFIQMHQQDKRTLIHKKSPLNNQLQPTNAQEMYCQRSDSESMNSLLQVLISNGSFFQKSLDSSSPDDLEIQMAMMPMHGQSPEYSALVGTRR